MTLDQQTYQPDVGFGTESSEEDALLSGLDDLEENEAETGEESDDTDSTKAAKGAKKTGSEQGDQAAKAPAAGLSRTSVRRVAAKAQEIAELIAEAHPAVPAAATLLKCGESITDLTTAIMLAPRTAATALNDLVEISDLEGVEAGIMAASLDKDRVRAVWALLGSISASFTENMPSNEMKAALALVRGISALTVDDQVNLARTADLLKKG